MAEEELPAVAPSFVSVAAGAYHTILVDAERQIVAFGDNSHGQLGLGDEISRRESTHVCGLQNVSSAAAGYDFTALLETGGRVHTSGFHPYGCVSSHDRFVAVEMPLSDSFRVRELAAGKNHLVLVDEDGNVFTYGEGISGQLGHGDYESHFVPKLMAALPDARVVRAAVGRYHTILLDSEGRVYTFGAGSDGQLGLGDVESRSEPTPVTMLSTERIVDIAAGDFHSVFVAEFGYVYTCGSNHSGQLGLGDRVNRTTPSIVYKLGLTALPRFVRAAAGGNHTILIDRGGHAHACGNNRKGQLGLGDDRECAVTPLPLLHEGKIAQAAAGAMHTVLLDEHGRVYACGNNKAGQLGLGGLKKTNTPTLVERQLV